MQYKYSDLKKSFQPAEQRINPDDEELIMAAGWSISHDISEGYRLSLKAFLREFGYEKASEQI